MIHIDRSKLIPLYLCSDGCYRRADELKAPGAVAMDAAKPVATDNGLTEEDYEMLRQAMAGESRCRSGQLHATNGQSIRTRFTQSCVVRTCLTFTSKTSN